MLNPSYYTGVKRKCQGFKSQKIISIYEYFTKNICKIRLFNGISTEELFNSTQQKKINIKKSKWVYIGHTLGNELFSKKTWSGIRKT